MSLLRCRANPCKAPMATSLNRFMIMALTRIFPAAAAFTLSALCLSGCATPSASASGPPPLNPIARFEMKTSAATDQIALAPHAEGLSVAQIDALKALAARRRQAVDSVVTVSLPHGAADAAAVGRTADQAQALLGVGGGRAVRSTYESSDPKAPILVSFPYEKVVSQACGRWDDLTATGDNSDIYANFGCAVTANMAAQIANPADIDHPRAEDAPDAERRAVVLDKYRAGKVTSADPPPVTSNIAHVGQ